MNPLLTISKTSIFALGGLILWLPACGRDDVTGVVETVSRATQALTVGEISSINGTYGENCDNRAGSWSIAAAPEAELDNDEVSVVLNDADCVLTLTEVHTTSGVVSANPAIPLSPSYAVSASTFGSPVEFYANANLTPAGFGSDFLITLPFSDDPTLLSGSHTASYAVVVSSVAAESVPTPDYTLDVSGITLLTDVDDVVQSASGTASLTEGSVAGQTYVVAEAGDLDTYAAIDTAYKSGSPTPITLSLPAADFTLVGEDLSTPVVRTVIIANISEGVASYEAFEITFNAPN